MQYIMYGRLFNKKINKSVIDINAILNKLSVSLSHSQFVKY